jgi:hypothetical protein
LSITNSSLSGNSASYYYYYLGNGGGIYNSGTLTLTSSTLSGNRAGSGGGISNSGTLTITNSTLSSNSAVSGGGIYNAGSYFSSSCSQFGCYSTTGNNGTVAVNNSTISDNSAVAGDGNSASSGGGIYNRGKFTLTNSTLSGNSAVGNGGGLYNEGGYFNSFCSWFGCYGTTGNGGTVAVSNSTISDNSAVAGGGIYNAQSQTPGRNDLAGSLSVRNSLIAGNRAVTGREVANQGIAISEGYNLFGYSRSSGVDGMRLHATDIVPKVRIDRILAPLANNGGPTQTHALVLGSPALNKADSNLTTPDQRGFSRVGRADIGAFEFQGAVLLVDFSEIIAALHGQSPIPLILTIQPELTEPLLCVVRSPSSEGQAIDAYQGLPDCPIQ